MILRRLTENLRAQNWTAITIEFLIVVFGVFIGMQVNNWNQARLEKVATEQLLVQLVPELRSQLELFDSVPRYYATTQRYAEQALAGWKGDPRVSDEQFVIAAYQASQTTGMTIESMSLTFGGDQIRNIGDPAVRRNLELVLTSDYRFFSSQSVATPYREQVRRIIPIDIQRDIVRECGDRAIKGQDDIMLFVLPTSCPLQIDPAQATQTAATLRARPELAGELNWHLGAVANYLENASTLAARIRKLDQQLAPSH